MNKLPITQRDFHLIVLSLGDESLVQAKLLKKMKVYDPMPAELMNLQHRLLEFQQEYRNTGKSDDCLFLVNGDGL